MLDLEADLLQLLADLADRLDRLLLLLPVCGQPVLVLLEVGELLFELLETFAGRFILLLAQRLALDLELHDPALDLIQLRGHRVDLHAQPRSRLVDEVDRLVGQEAVGDVAVREHRRRDQRRVLELHTVVNLVPLAETTQNADRHFDRRLADEHGLEAPLERRIFFDVLAILVERGGADGMQLAAGEHRLEHVGRVHRPFGRARADNGVQLVDEQDDLPLGIGHLFQDGLQPLFELTPVFRTGDQRAHVEGDDLLVLETFGHVLADDALREALDDRGLPDARFTYKDRVVLRPPREHLNDAPNLLVPADDRIQLALARELGQIATVLLECLVGRFRVLTRDALRSANARQRLQHLVAPDAALLQDLPDGGAPAFAGDREEQVLGADVLVLQPLRFLFRGVGHTTQPAGQADLRSAVRAWKLVQLGANLGCQRCRISVQLANDAWNDAFLLFEEHEQQVLGHYLGMPFAVRELLRAEDRLLRFLCVLVDVHPSRPI